MYGKEKKTAKALALNELILAIKEKNSKVTTPEWDALYKDLADLAAQGKNYPKAEAYLKSGDRGLQKQIRRARPQNDQVFGKSQRLLFEAPEGSISTGLIRNVG